jgi:hypothetical protein
VGNGDANIRATYYLSLFAPNFITVDQFPVSLTVLPQNFGATPDVDVVVNQTAPFTVVLRDSLNHPDPREISISWSITPFGTVPATTLSTGEALVSTGASTGTTTLAASGGALVGSRTLNIVATGVSYATSIRSLLNTTCAGAGCHGINNPMQGLRLNTDSSYKYLFNRAATELPAMKRVNAFHPDSSYMIHKIQGTQSTVGGAGVRMPEGCPGTRACLPDATINLIRNWILQGALNN